MQSENECKEDMLIFRDKHKVKHKVNERYKVTKSETSTTFISKYYL